MTIKKLRVIWVAAASGKIGMVFFVDGNLMDWELSVKASRTPDEAAEQMRKRFEFYTPDLVITEKITLQTRKSKLTQSVIAAMAQVGQAARCQWIETERVQTFGNKYHEAAALAARYPQISNWAPKERKIWMPEARSTIFFEILAMTEEITKPERRTNPICRCASMLVRTLKLTETEMSDANTVRSLNDRSSGSPRVNLMDLQTRLFLGCRSNHAQNRPYG